MKVRKLLDKVRICMIPMLNPDSYEICEYGYSAIHNPIHRQMLKMQDRPVEEYECNARGIDLRRNSDKLLSAEKSESGASQRE